MGWNTNDLTTSTNAPLAQLRPFGYMYTGDGTQHVVYEGFTPGEGSDGHVHELWWNGTWHHNDLTNASGAPFIGAGSSPTGYFFPQSDEIYGSQHVIYVGVDSHVHEIWDTTDDPGWTHHDLTALANATPAINVAAGFGYNNFQHVFYEGTDLHIHMLTWDSDSGWYHTDLSASTGAPAASGSPNPYIFYRQGTLHAVYRGLDGHIHELWYSSSTGWAHNDLTQRTGAPLASDDPAGCVLHDVLLQHVGYRGVDGHINELRWLNDSWTHIDINATIPGVTPAASGPLAAYGFDWQQTLHFVYTNTDGHISEFWFAGTEWNLNDLYFAGAPLAISSPSGYVYDAQETQHVFYTDTDHHVIELWWSA